MQAAAVVASLTQQLRRAAGLFADLKRARVESAALRLRMALPSSGVGGVLVRRRRRRRRAGSPHTAMAGATGAADGDASPSAAAGEPDGADAEMCKAIGEGWSVRGGDESRDAVLEQENVQLAEAMDSLADEVQQAGSKIEAIAMAQRLA